MKRVVLMLWVLGLSACGPAQSPECAKYVTCAAAIDEVVGSSTDTTGFDEGGSCWMSDAAAASCTTSCTRALDSLSDGYPDIDACQP